MEKLLSDTYIEENLPANLPAEYWTNEKNISAGGEEIGLSHIYGYKYLNKQVNNAQKAIIDLNNAVSDICTQVSANDEQTAIALSLLPENQDKLVIW